MAVWNNLHDFLNILREYYTDQDLYLTKGYRWVSLFQVLLQDWETRIITLFFKQELDYFFGLQMLKVRLVPILIKNYWMFLQWKFCLKQNVYLTLMTLEKLCLLLLEFFISLQVQKQPPRGVSRKRCSENMPQIYWRTPIPKCDFNKVALQLYWNCTSPWVFSCKFATYFQNTFS